MCRLVNDNSEEKNMARGNKDKQLIPANFAEAAITAAVALVLWHQALRPYVESTVAKYHLDTDTGFYYDAVIVPPILTSTGIALFALAALYRVTGAPAIAWLYNNVYHNNRAGYRNLDDAVEQNYIVDPRSYPTLRNVGRKVYDVSFEVLPLALLSIVGIPLIPPAVNYYLLALGYTYPTYNQDGKIAAYVAIALGIWWQKHLTQAMLDKFFDSIPREYVPTQDRAKWTTVKDFLINFNKLLSTWSRELRFKDVGGEPADLTRELQVIQSRVSVDPTGERIPDELVTNAFLNQLLAKYNTRPGNNSQQLQLVPVAAELVRGGPLDAEAAYQQQRQPGVTGQAAVAPALARLTHERRQSVVLSGDPLAQPAFDSFNLNYGDRASADPTSVAATLAVRLTPTLPDTSASAAEAAVLDVLENEEDGLISSRSSSRGSSNA